MLAISLRITFSSDLAMAGSFREKGLRLLLLLLFRFSFSIGVDHEHGNGYLFL